MEENQEASAGTGASWHQNTDRLSERQANRDDPEWYGCPENGGEVPG